MEPCYRPTRVEISLDAVQANVAAFRRVLPAEMKLMAVVKANGYGHGAIQIAREAEACGVHYLGVAFLDEAIELRRAGITMPVLVLGYTPTEGIEAAIAHDVTLAVFSEELLQAAANQPLRIHIKLDTGMGRLGLHDADQAVSFIRRALATPGLEVEGLFTHYACADEADTSYTHEQHRKFSDIVELFRREGVTFPVLHAGNSATAIQFPELSYNMVRLGISLYGLYPSDEVNQARVELQPVMSYKTGVVLLKKLPPGSSVSYGATYQTHHEERVATLPVGYADGFSRMLTGKAQVLVRGERAPVIGRICMDQCVISVDHIEGVGLGDEVVIFGSQNGKVITADDIARQLGTINYEVTCMVSHRVPRIYTRNGRIESIVNPLTRANEETFFTNL